MPVNSLQNKQPSSLTHCFNNFNYTPEMYAAFNCLLSEKRILRYEAKALDSQI